MPTNATSPDTDRNTGLLSAILSLMLLSAAGCHTEQYEGKYQASLVHLQHETPFQGLWPEPVKDFRRGQLSIRLPKFFLDGEANAFEPPPALSADPKRPQDVVDPYRVMPYFLQLPGHLRTYEGFTEVQSRQDAQRIKKPFYLYIGMVGSKQSNDKPLTGEDLRKLLRDRLVKYAEHDDTLKNVKLEVGQWEDVEPKPKTPDGGEMSWKRIKATGDQAFVFYEDKVATKKLYPGMCELWVYSTPDYHVMLGWRCSQAVADTIALDKAAGPCAGSVKVGD